MNSGSFVYPRLPREAALALIHGRADTPLPTLRDLGRPEHEAAGYYATGTRAPAERLEALATVIRSTLDELGFPEPGSKQKARTAFDQALPGILYEALEIVPADAAHEGVWSFITLVLVPEVGPWRYPDRTEERLIGTPRNVLRRLWWRAEWLGVGPADPPATMGEDQLVAVMERPRIGADVPLARALCGCVRAVTAENRGLSGMLIMRDAAKRLTRLTPSICTAALDERELSDLVREVVREAVVSFGGDPGEMLVEEQPDGALPDAQPVAESGVESPHDELPATGTYYGFTDDQWQELEREGLRHLEHLARRRVDTDYSSICKAIHERTGLHLDPDSPALRHLLGRLSRRSFEERSVLITVLVRYKHGSDTGGGLFTVAQDLGLLPKRRLDADARLTFQAVHTQAVFDAYARNTGSRSH